jgi:hypothetical protein
MTRSEGMTSVVELRVRTRCQPSESGVLAFVEGPGLRCILEAIVAPGGPSFARFVLRRVSGESGGDWTARNLLNNN